METSVIISGVGMFTAIILGLVGLILFAKSKLHLATSQLKSTMTLRRLLLCQQVESY